MKRMEQLIGMLIRREYQLLRKFPFWNRRAAFIMNLPSDSTVLSIGCEEGRTLRKFLVLRGDLKFTGIDIVDRRNDLPDQVSFAQCDVTQVAFPFPDDYFDAIVMIHLIEHLSTFDNLLQEAMRVLKRRGKMYLETPGIRKLFLPSIRVGLKTQPHVAMNFLDDYSHVSLFTIGKLAYLLMEHGFILRKVGIMRNVGVLLISPMVALVGLLTWNRRMIVSAISSLVGVNVFAIAQK